MPSFGRALVVAGIWLLLVGCPPGLSSGGPPRGPAALTPLDASYRIDDQEFTLEGGKVTVPGPPGAASKTVVEIVGVPVSGDLDGDGQQDAVVLLVQTTGGSGTFYYAAAALKRGETFLGTPAVFVGDRIAPRNLSIRHGVVNLDYAQRRPGEAMATAPSLAASKYLVNRGDRLEEVVLTESQRIFAGAVVIGHEVRSFTPCDSNRAVWLLGDSPALAAVQSAYRQAMPETRPYAPVFMVLAGEIASPPAEGFGAEFPAGFRVSRLLRSLPGGACSMD